MIRTKFAARAAIAAVGALAISVLALPAMADTGDIDGYKSWYFDDPDLVEGVDLAVDGDLVWFYTVQANDSDQLQQNVIFNDDMEAGLVYVAQSTFVNVWNYIATTWSYPDGGTSTVTDAVAKDELPAISVPGDTNGTRYSSPGADTGQGNGWVGDWFEANDDGNEAAGVVQSYGGAGGLGDNNSISFTGPVAAPAAAADTTGPAIVRQFDAGAWEDLQLIFQTNGANLDGAGDDTLGVWISGDGTGWTLVDTFEPGGADAARVVDISALEGDSTAFIRVGPNSALEASEIWGVDNFIIAGVKPFFTYYDNAVDGANNLDDGAVPSLITSADSIDLNPVVNFNGHTYHSQMSVYYGATVDTSATINYDTYLQNTVRWRSDAYGIDESEQPEFNSSGTGIEVQYEPEIDIKVTSNSPVQVGQPIVITVVFTHGAGSDGSPVCVDGDGVTLPPGFTVINDVASGGDSDLCLEEGETWTFTLTYPPRATAGTVPFGAAFAGYSVNQGSEDPIDVSVTASTDVVVVLAATGPASGSAAGISVALIAMGVGMLVVVRRRTALA